MSSRVQQITIRLKGLVSEATPPPGNPRMWEALENKLGRVGTFRSQALQIEWLNDDPFKRPTKELWDDWLVFGGLQETELADSTRTATLQIRRRGHDSDSVVTLVKELLKARGFGGYKNIWFLRQFEFVYLDPKVSIPTAEQAGPLAEGIQQALGGLGARTGIYHPEIEEARVLKPGDQPEWLSPDDQIAQNPKAFSEIFHAAITEGTWSVLRRPFKLIEKRPRVKLPTVENLKDPLALKFRTDNRVDESLERGGSAEAPMSFLVSLPRNPDLFSNFDKFRYKCEQISALYDRSLGLVTFRQASPGPQVFDVWSPLPLHNRPLGHAPNIESELYVLGPWDVRNTAIERRIECWLHTSKERLRLLGAGEVVDGEQDWLAYLSQILAREKDGWRLDPIGGAELVRQSIWRTRYQRAWFFWMNDHAQEFLDDARKLGIPLLPVARRIPGGKELILEGSQGQEPKVKMPMNWLNSAIPDKDPPREVQWTYPEVKSPTYGFDRVAKFPDEFMMKVTYRDSAESQWVREVKRFYSGDRFRSVTLRNMACLPLNGFRWTDGENLWAESFGSREGWIDVDPRAAGFAAVDSALRGLVALGARPEGAVGYVWASQPEDTDNPEESTANWAAYLLSLEGATNAAKAYDIKFYAINGGGISYPGVKHEVYINLRSKLVEYSQATMPGFRMSGEALYIVGPRPAFVDAGSRVIAHVTRVFSNHISRISAETQLELYRLLHDLLRKGTITSIRPVGEGGVAAAVAEMCLWGGIGAQIRPNLTPMELFSGSPGRFVVGVLPQEAKNFESLIKGEFLTQLGSTGGEKVLGLPLARLIESRRGPAT